MTETEHPEEDLLRVGEAAKLLGVTTVTLRHWTEQGVITSVRTVGGHRRYRIADVLALRDRKVKP